MGGRHFLRVNIVVEKSHSCQRRSAFTLTLTLTLTLTTRQRRSACVCSVCSVHSVRAVPRITHHWTSTTGLSARLVGCVNGAAAARRTAAGLRRPPVNT